MTTPTLDQLAAEHEAAAANLRNWAVLLADDAVAARTISDHIRDSYLAARERYRAAEKPYLAALCERVAQ